MNSQGIACKACHEVHASPQAKLLRAKIEGPNKSLTTTTYKETPTGGSCTTSCHDPLSYSR